MKKIIILLLLLFVISHTVFSTDNKLPVFMFELNTGYAAGINLDNATFLNAKLIYPFERFGFTIQAGGLFLPDDSAFNIFLGPMMFLVNNQRWRVPLTLGLDIISINEALLYRGVGGILAVHRSLANNFYVGLNLRMTYAFSNVYQERVRERTTILEVKDDGTLVTRTVGVYESRSRFGNYIFIKPSLAIGLQF